MSLFTEHAETMERVPLSPVALTLLDLIAEPRESATLGRSISHTHAPETVQVARASDPGYGRTKRIMVCGRTYTEDRSAELTYIHGDTKWKVMWLTDGHGGDAITKFVASRFGVYFKSFADQRISSETGKPDMESTLRDLIAHIQTEVSHKASTDYQFRTCGCTFCACVINTSTNEMTVANLGDSVCQVVRDGVQVFRTRDHDAGSPDEQARIRDAFRQNVSVRPRGLTSSNLFFSDRGTIRLHGGLMVTAGFGDYDHDMFPGCIRRVPDISTVRLQPEDVMILSSDGLLETFKSGGLGPGRDETEICHDVLEYLDAPPTGLSLSQHLISSHVNSISQKLMTLPQYRTSSSAQLAPMILNAKDNCDVITHCVPTLSPSLARCVSVP